MSGGEAAEIKAAARPRALSVPCPDAFRRAVERLAARRGATPSDLARMAWTLAGGAHPACPDPGPPAPDDRVVKVSQSADGVVRQRRLPPTLKLRVPPEIDAVGARRALALALALADPAEWRLERETAAARRDDAAQAAIQRADRMAATLDQIAFRVPPGPIRTPAQAAQLLGFPHALGLAEASVAARYRSLAAIFHPDSGLAPSAERMAQLADARKILASALRED